jgi:hypothetical protein
VVVKGDKGLVLVQGLQGLHRLDGVRHRRGRGHRSAGALVCPVARRSFRQDPCGLAFRHDNLWLWTDRRLGTFDLGQAKELLLSHFKVVSLGGFGLEDKPLAVSAAGGLLYYLKKVRKDSLALVQRRYSPAIRGMLIQKM